MTKPGYVRVIIDRAIHRELELIALRAGLLTPCESIHHPAEVSARPMPPTHCREMLNEDHISPHLWGMSVPVFVQID